MDRKYKPTLFLYLFFLINIGFFGFVFSSINKVFLYSNYVDDFMFLLGFSFTIFLMFENRIKLTLLTFIIFSYFLLRMFIVSFFALFNGYSLVDYIFPLKNWLTILLWFTIGQSLSSLISEKDVIKLATQIFQFFLTIVIIFYIYIYFSGKSFESLKISRIPFIPYRILINSFFIGFIFLKNSLFFLEKRISVFSYVFIIFLCVLSFFCSQTKQLLAGIILIIIYLLFSRVKNIIRMRFSKRYLTLLPIFLFLLSFSFIIVCMILTKNISINYFSLKRREILMDFAMAKIQNHFIFGYPIPSNLFRGKIPDDIIHYFYTNNFNVTIYPSDIPLVSVLMEEGITGICFIIYFIYRCYKVNYKIKEVIILLIAFIGLFPMYYLMMPAVTFLYFLLGFYTGELNEKYTFHIKSTV